MKVSPVMIISRKKYKKLVSQFIFLLIAQLFGQSTLFGQKLSLFPTKEEVKDGLILRKEQLKKELVNREPAFLFFNERAAGLCQKSFKESLDQALVKNEKESSLYTLLPENFCSGKKILGHLLSIEPLKDRHLIALSFSSGEILIWDLSIAQERARFIPEHFLEKDLTDPTVTQDDFAAYWPRNLTSFGEKKLAILYTGVIIVWDYSNNTADISCEEDSCLDNFCTDYEKKELMTWSSNSVIAIFTYNQIDEKKKLTLKKILYQKEEGALLALIYAGKNYLLTGTDSGAITLWNYNNEKIIKKYFHEQEPIQALLLLNNDSFVSATAGGKLLFWNTANNQKPIKIFVLSNLFLSLTIGPEGSFYALFADGFSSKKKLFLCKKTLSTEDAQFFSEETAQTYSCRELDLRSLITGNKIIFDDTILLATTNEVHSGRGIALASNRDLYFFYSESNRSTHEPRIDPVVFDEGDDILSLSLALSHCTLL